MSGVVCCLCLVLSVVCCLLFVVWCCLLFVAVAIAVCGVLLHMLVTVACWCWLFVVVCCSLFVFVCYLLFVVCCLQSIVRCSVFGGRCLLCGVCNVLIGRYFWFIVRCNLLVAC